LKKNREDLDYPQKIVTAMITIWVFLLMIGLQKTESKIHERKVIMAFDGSVMAEHKDSNFFLVPQIEMVVKETKSERNSTNEKLCESAATQALIELEIIQLKEGFLMQHESKSAITKKQKIEAMREPERSVERGMWIILTTILLILIISVPMLMTNQYEYNQLQLLEMTVVDEANGSAEITVKSSNGIQQPNELAEIRHQYDGKILKLRSQLIDEATLLVTIKVYFCIDVYRCLRMPVCMSIHIRIYICINMNEYIYTSLVTIKEECISLQKALDVMVANTEDLDHKIVSLETAAKEQNIKSNELIELLKVLLIALFSCVPQPIVVDDGRVKYVCLCLYHLIR
jgi:hypothetical protein